MVKKIAITSSGPMSGKTTLAKYLEKEYGFLRVDHSLTIAEDYVAYYNLHADGPKITVKDIYQDKEYWRPNLQEHSRIKGVSSVEYADLWADLTLKPWYDTGQTRDVVFEPFRGEVQADSMRRKGFIIVQLEIDELTRMARAGKGYEQMRKSMEGHMDIEGGIEHPDLRVGGEMPTWITAHWLNRLAETRQGS